MARIVWRPYDYVREDEAILDNVNDGKNMEACDLYKNENHNGDKTNGVSKNHKGWKRLYEILWLNTTFKAIELVLYNIRYIFSCMNSESHLSTSLNMGKRTDEVFHSWVQYFLQLNAQNVDRTPHSFQKHFVEKKSFW